LLKKSPQIAPKLADETRVAAMDQTTTLVRNDHRRAADRLAEFIQQSVDSARAVEKPFFHLEFDRVFPDDIYAQTLNLMPESDDYRPMHGRSKA
jgi:hypothetical protein